MKNINKILIQLDKAVTLANSTLPQERALSVILFDNIIEIQLYKKLSHVFLIDRASWYNGKRVFDQKKRAKAMKQYVGLLQVAKDAGIITEQQLQILKYAHEVRNKAYHTDKYKDGDIDMALELYNFVIKQNKVLFMTGTVGHTDKPGYEMIDFGQGIDSNDSMWDLNSEEYFDKAQSYILSKLKVTSDFRGLAQNYLNSQYGDIKNSIEFLEKERKNFNYYAALGMYWFMSTIFYDYEQKKISPRNLDSILLCTRYVRQHEDELSDVDNIVERQKRGNYLYRKFRNEYKGKYPYSPDLRSIKKRIDNLPYEIHRAIGSLIQIEMNWGEFRKDLLEATILMDGFIMEEFDRYKGK